jgi:hypothetical protein
MGSASRMKVEREYDERIVINRYLAAIENATGCVGSRASGRGGDVLAPG